MPFWGSALPANIVNHSFIDAAQLHVNLEDYSTKQLKDISFPKTLECLLPRCYISCFFHRKHGLKSARAELLLQSTHDVTIAGLGAICLKSGTVQV